VRFHHVSTDEVYGSLGARRRRWSRARLRAALALRRVEGRLGSPGARLRHDLRPADHAVELLEQLRAVPVPEKLVPLMIVNGVLGKPLPVYGDGLQIRDWLHVDDHCAAIVAIVERGRVGATYHVGGGNQPTNLELVGAAVRRCSTSGCRARRTGRTAGLITHVADRPGHDRRYDLDCGKLERELDWRPRTISRPAWRPPSTGTRRPGLAGRDP
jgi:dTDP-glucose 4,6-dehydratase